MNGIYNRLPFRLGNGSLDWDNMATNVYCMLLRDTGTYVFDPDHDVVNDILSGGGGVEISVASYARKLLANRTVTLDDTNNWTKYSCDNVAFGSLETGQTVEAIVFYEHVTTDADHIPLLYIDGKFNITAAAPVVAAPSGSITNATQANPVVITSNAHGLSANDKVKITGVGGMTEINDRIFTVANPTTNTFELSGENGTGHTAYTSGGTWKKVMDCYVEPLEEEVADGTAVDFGGGATGTINGLTAQNSRKIEIVDLAAAITEGDASSNVQSTMNLPSALGGGPYNVNIPTNGLFRGLRS